MGKQQITGGERNNMVFMALTTPLLHGEYETPSEGFVIISYQTVYMQVRDCLWCIFHCLTRNKMTAMWQYYNLHFTKEFQSSCTHVKRTLRHLMKIPAYASDTNR